MNPTAPLVESLQNTSSTSAVASVDPLSTKMISNGCRDRSALKCTNAGSSCAARFRVQTMMLSLMVMPAARQAFGRHADAAAMLSKSSSVLVRRRNRLAAPIVLKGHPEHLDIRPSGRRPTSRCNASGKSKGYCIALGRILRRASTTAYPCGSSMAASEPASTWMRSQRPSSRTAENVVI